MRLGGRVQAAIEVVEEIFVRRRPAASALSDWGKAHRFAGSGDRSAIGSLVYDVLRQRNSLAARMESDTPRAVVLASAPHSFDVGADELAAAVDGSRHAPKQITTHELTGLSRSLPDDAPMHVVGNYPEHLSAHMARVFGDDAGSEGAALAERAPVDLRVNALKATRAEAQEALAHFTPSLTRFSPWGLRIAPRDGAKRQAHVEAEAAHGQGLVEVQDEASQIAAMLVDAQAGHRVLDLCAGAGGKTLALAAAMDNTGALTAFDRSKPQLRPIYERVTRAGATIVEVVDGGDVAALMEGGARFDRVLVDAPCTGSGTWRRRPDTKWRLRPKNITDRIAEQRAALATAAQLVVPGGRLVYVTCSLFAEENQDQAAWFATACPGFAAVPYADVWASLKTDAAEHPPLVSAVANDASLLLTPRQHGTDGFFVAIFSRMS